MRKKLTLGLILLLTIALSFSLGGCKEKPEDVQTLTTKLDEADHTLCIMAPQKANRWILTNQRGDILAEKKTEMKKYTKFDIEKIKEVETVKVQVFEDDKFLCQTKYVQKLESTVNEEELIIETFSPKKTDRIELRFKKEGLEKGVMSLLKSENEDGHRFTAKIKTFQKHIEEDHYTVSIQGFDNQDNPLYSEEEKIEIKVEY